MSLQDTFKRLRMFINFIIDSVPGTSGHEIEVTFDFSFFFTQI